MSYLVQQEYRQGQSEGDRLDKNKGCRLFNLEIRQIVASYPMGRKYSRSEKEAG